MPWVQVSCAGEQDSLSGLDLARSGHTLLWLVPAAMAVVIFSSIVCSSQRQRRALSIACMLFGMMTVYLMNRERLRVNDESALLAVRLTGWYWLGMISAIASVITQIAILLKRQRAP